MSDTWGGGSGCTVGREWGSKGKTFEKVFAQISRRGWL